MLGMGRWAQRRNKNAGDFYLAGRKLGKFTQFFLNFGASTNADQAVAVTREIYRQGIGGMWIQYLVLFLTPFYWFTTAFMRRSPAGRPSAISSPSGSGAGSSAARSPSSPWSWPSSAAA